MKKNTNFLAKGRATEESLILDEKSLKIIEKRLENGCYSPEEVVAKLSLIRDILLDKWTINIVKNVNTGTGALSDFFVRVQGALERAEDRMEDKKVEKSLASGGNFVLTFMEPPAPEVVEIIDEKIN